MRNIVILFNVFDRNITVMFYRHMASAPYVPTIADLPNKLLAAEQKSKTIAIHSILVYTEEKLGRLNTD